MSVKITNLKIIDQLKDCYDVTYNWQLADKLGISKEHLCRINNKRSEIPHWFKLLLEAFND